MRALVLEGGGAKGAYQIGAWQLLRERGEQFDLVTGTSVGALNGALIVQGDFEAAYDLWYNASLDQVIAGQPELLERLVKLDINLQDYPKMMRFLRQVAGEKGLDISPMERRLRQVVDESRMRASAMRFGIVTVSLTEKKPLELALEQIPEGALHDYLIASSNLPVFKMSRVKGQMYIDGGFYDNLPLRLASRMGATEFTTIELGSIGVKRIPRDLKYRRIAPREDLGPMLDFTAERVRRNLKLGYFDAMKVLDGLRGNRYYLRPELDEDRLVARLATLDVSALAQLAAVLGVAGMDPRRFTFELLLPKVGELLGVSGKAPYSEMLIGLLEAMSESLSLDPFEVRGMADWLQELHGAYVPGAILGEMRLLDKLFMQTSVFGSAQRQALLRTVYEKLIYEVTL